MNNIFIAFLVRLLLSLFPGHLDVNTFAFWGKLASLSLSQLFSHSWIDYLPFFSYFLALIYRTAIFIHLPFSFLFKFTLSLIELYLLVKLFPKSKLSFLLFPPLLLTTALWGQIDGLIALLLLLSYRHLPSRPFLSALLFTLTILIKPLSFLILPFYLLLSRHPLRHLLLTFITLLLLANFTTFPVTHTLSFSRNLSFLISILFKRVGEYPYTSVNTYNFWGLVVGLWQSDQHSFLYLTFQQWGWILFLSFLFPLFLATFQRHLHHTSSSRFLYLATALSLFLFATFFTRIHERYLLYPLIFLLPFISSLPKLFLSFNFIYIINLFASFFWPSHQSLFLFHPAFVKAFSFLEVISTLVLFIFLIKPKLNFSFLHRHWQHLCFLMLLASFLRFLFLSYPSPMIFDEVYHAFTAKIMLANDLRAWEWWHQPPPGYAYEWTHPPLAKYGMVLGMRLFGPHAFGWRFFSAVLGVASILVFYFFSFTLTHSSRLAFLASLLLTFDGLHLVQSRIAMNDIYLLFFLLLAFTFLILKRWWLLGFVWGLALASKWTAVYFLFPFLYFLLSLPFPFLTKMKHFLVVSLLAFLTYLLTYLPFFLTHSLTLFIQLHQQMFFYHTRLQATHPYQSTPFQWLFDIRPVWYFVHHSPLRQANIYALSSPLPLWLGLGAIVYLFFVRSKISFFIIISYFSFFLPWVFSPRIMFFYHYLPALPFLYLALAYFLTSLSYRSTILITFLILFSSLLILPLNLGLPMPNSYFSFLFTLFPFWR